MARLNSSKSSNLASRAARSATGRPAVSRWGILRRSLTTWGGGREAWGGDADVKVGALPGMGGRRQAKSADGSRRWGTQLRGRQRLQEVAGKNGRREGWGFTGVQLISSVVFTQKNATAQKAQKAKKYNKEAESLGKHINSPKNSSNIFPPHLSKGSLRQGKEH